MSKCQARYSSVEVLRRILESDSDPSDLDNSDIVDDDDHLAGSDENSETEDHVSGQESDEGELDDAGGSLEEHNVDRRGAEQEVAHDIQERYEENRDERDRENAEEGDRRRGRERGRGRIRRGTRGRRGARGRGRGRGREYNDNIELHQQDDIPQLPPADNPRPNQIQPDVLTGKNGKLWSINPPVIHRRGRQDIIRQHAGITAEGRVENIKDAFGLFLTNEILDIIMRETNREANRVFGQWNMDHAEHQKTWKPLNQNELKAFVGLLILAGVNHSAHESLEELWEAKTGRPIFRATMTLNRFKIILRFLRFDNKTTRPERRAQDKLAAIRDVWAMFISQLPKFYIPSTDLTVDEQLVPFRGRCPFRQYIKSKPAKYGIKIWWNCDAVSSYPLNGQVYLGKQANQAREVNQGARVVKDMVRPWFGTGRNVNADNFFTSVPLVEELLAQQLTYVGTIRKNKPDIPPEIQPSRAREEHSSVFGFTDQLTLVSYVPKRNNAVTMLSSMHHDQAVEGDLHKPEIITHYNAHKGGVDNMDHLAGTYSVKRKSNRWPMVLFYNIIDVSGIAAYVVWLCNFPNWRIQKGRSRRRYFLQALGESLVNDLLQQRLQNPKALQKGVKSAFVDLGMLEIRQNAAARPPALKKRCYLCPREADRKIRQCCTTCGNNVCKDHSTPSVCCNECA